ncbi:MAG TPA: DUF3298 domain-containing protein [Bacillota bacterium]|nr:DUF3298 domain-containing protein [Bacillota bacterium]
MVMDQDFRAQLRQWGTTYPRVINLSHSVQQSINRSIKEAAIQAIPTYDPGTPVIEATSSYTTPLNMKGILSLRFEDYYYPEHAAHGVTGISSITVNLKNGHVYKFNELFRPNSNYQAVLTRIVQEQIVSKQISLINPYPGVGTDEDFYLTPDSLVIYYQPYIYTPGVYGILEFTIPYAQITEIIDPRGPIGQILYP